jgi:hypothetical protein
LAFVIAARRIQRRLEYCSEFTHFFVQPLQIGAGSQFDVKQQFEPMFGLVGFLDDNAEFRYELAPRARPAGGMIVLRILRDRI